MSWFDQLAQEIGQAIWSAMGEILGVLLAPIVNWMLSNSVSAIAFTPSLNYGFIGQLYDYTYGVFLAALLLVLVGIGMLYVASPFIEKKVRYKTIWSKLFTAVIVASAAFLIGNLAISLVNQLTVGVFSLMGCNASGNSCSSLGDLWGGLANTLANVGGLTVPVIDIITIILLLTLLIENGVRILMIFFTFVLLPWGLLLWAFPTTQSYGTKILKMFAEWLFVGVFMSIVITLTVLSIEDGNFVSSDPALAVFVFLGGLSLAAAVPKIMTDSGGAVSQVGQAVLGGVLGGTMMAEGFSPIGGAGSGPAGGGSAVSAFKGLGGAFQGLGSGAGTNPLGAMGSKLAAGGPVGVAAGAALKGIGKMAGAAGKAARAAPDSALGRAGHMARSSARMMAFRPAAGAAGLGAAAGLAVVGGIGKAASKGVSAAKNGIASHRAVAAGQAAGLSKGEARSVAGMVRSGEWSPSKAGLGNVDNVAWGKSVRPLPWSDAKLKAGSTQSQAFLDLEDRVRKARGEAPRGRWSLSQPHGQTRPSAG